MQQQGEEPPCESQETSHPESQNETSDEVVPDATPSDVEGENDCKDSVLETTAAASADDIDAENGINDSVPSDPLPTRSKTSQNSKKRRSKLDKGDVDSAENVMKSEERQDNGVSETDIAPEDASTLMNNMTNDVEEDIQDIIVDEQDETITLETSGESSHAEYTVEFPLEDGKKEDSQDIVIEEEEISVSESVSYEEVDESKGKCTEASEKYSLTVSSTELHQFLPIFNGQEHTSISDNLSVSASSWGGKIRSVSARKSMCNSSRFAMHGRSSVSAERAGTDGNYSDTDCSVDTTEGSIFSSLKRKACDEDTAKSKKQKLNDFKNSNFFSMVSLPLRKLKNKLNDRLVESSNAPCTEDISNGSNENKDEITTDKIKREDNKIKEKSLCVMSNEVNNENSLYRSWCSLM